MDTSKEYIEMCDAAEEIQAISKPLDIVYAQRWNGKNKEISYSSHYGFDKYLYDLQVYSLEGEEKKMNERWIEKLIWLPRQDQLQEITFSSNTPTHPVVVNEFWYFMNGFIMPKNSRPQSMEQFTLMLLMRKLYTKWWNGKNWELINTLI